MKIYKQSLMLAGVILFLSACGSSSISDDKNTTAQDLVDYLNNVPGKKYGFQVDFKDNYKNYDDMPDAYKDGSTSFWLLESFSPGFFHPEALFLIGGRLTSRDLNMFQFAKMPSKKLAKEVAGAKPLCIARGYWVLCGFKNSRDKGLDKEDMIKLFSDF